ncbi:MAG TPA: hypothetical protein VFY28_00605 [Candidatus Paceibacterota bacterium]|nr:hypothetical protein [Candidatus Paceibacterota bacterium]
MDTPSPAAEPSSGTPAPAAPAAPPRKKSWGGLIGILLIVAAIVLGALYSWGERIALEEARSASIGE